MTIVLLVAATELELCDRHGPRLRGRAGRGRGGDGGASSRVDRPRAVAARRDRGRPRHHSGRRSSSAARRSTRPLGRDPGRRPRRAGPEPPRGACARRSRTRSSLPIGDERRGRAAPRRSDLRVEAMEGFGVLRACALAGVPASRSGRSRTSIGEGDRSRWSDRARARGARRRAPARARSAPLSSVSRAWRGEREREERPLPPPLPPEQRTVGQLVAEAIRALRRALPARAPARARRRGVNQLRVGVEPRGGRRAILLARGARSSRSATRMPPSS